jgi:hypothetical protein
VTTGLDFSDPFEESGDERARMLEAAGRRLDALSGQLGPGGRREPSEEGDFARAFAKDVVTVQEPTIYRLEVDDLDAARRDMPVDVAELTRMSKFYWLELPVSLWARPGWGFNRLEARIEFTGDGGATTFDLLPDQEFATRFQANTEVSLGVDAGMKFAATVPTVAVGQVGVAGLEAGAHAGATAAAQTGFVLGPFKYRVTAPKVKHSATGLDHVFWRLDGAEYVNERDPGMRAVVRVPKEAQELEVRATIQARRYFSMFSARFQEAVQNLPGAIANFFKGGTPIGDSDSWKLGAQM